MTPAQRRQYRQGMCDVMALALHDLTGLPLVKIVGLKRSRNTWCEEPVHIAVGDRKLWIDVDGIHDEIPHERLRFALFEPERVTIRPISRDEVMYLYAMGGVSRSDLDTARHAALNDPLLGIIVRSLRKPAARSRRRRS